MKPDLLKVFEWDRYFEKAGSKDEDREIIENMHAEARSFIEFFDWCDAVVSEYVGFIYPGIVGVFLFRIKPAWKNVDEWVWCIVGDLPPAYITCEESPNPATALDSYIGAMQDWVDAASNGRSTEGLIPVDVEPTIVSAERLGVRLRYLDEKILSGYREDLGAR
ncbi:MAG: hypothetical protein V4757_19275 [Pseudomonadota bacterium]